MRIVIPEAYQPGGRRVGAGLQSQAFLRSVSLFVFIRVGTAVGNLGKHWSLVPLVLSPAVLGSIQISSFHSGHAEPSSAHWSQIGWSRGISRFLGPAYPAFSHLSTALGLLMPLASHFIHIFLINVFGPGNLAGTIRTIALVETLGGCIWD